MKTLEREGQRWFIINKNEKEMVKKVYANYNDQLKIFSKKSGKRKVFMVFINNEYICNLQSKAQAYSFFEVFKSKF